MHYTCQKEPIPQRNSWLTVFWTTLFLTWAGLLLLVWLELHLTCPEGQLDCKNTDEEESLGKCSVFFVSSDFEQNCFNWCCLICVLCFQMNNINTLFYGKINWILQFERNLRRKTSIYIVKRKPQKLLNSSIKYIFDQTLTNDFLVF